MNRDPETQFRDAIIAAGLTPPSEVIGDGKIHRYSTNGKAGDKAGYYVLHLDGIPAGAFGCWRGDVKSTWCATPDGQLTQDQRADNERRWQVAREDADRVREQERLKAEARALKLWGTSPDASARHFYLEIKRVKAHGLRESGENLLVPLRDVDGNLKSLQTINVKGTKKFFPGCGTTGGFHTLGEIGPSILIAEGYATAASLHEATGLPVAVAFNCKNLLPVAEALRAKYPEAKLTIAADDDGEGNNPGRTHAEDAARITGAKVVLPNFGYRRDPDWTDFNDLAVHRGPEAVREQLAGASEVEWPDPLPLMSHGAPEPYPLDALPELVRRAVAEVQGFSQAPVALVAGSALSVLSLAVQSLADVQRAEGLSGPCGLYLLTVADSGERKTSTDNLFRDPIQKWELDQAENAKPGIANYHGAFKVWKAKNEGLELRVKAGSKQGKSTAAADSDLRDHEVEKPLEPRFPQLLRGDDTSENLAFILAHKWPSAGIISSEAGLIFGAHAMGGDKVMRNLSQLNVLWDGGVLKIGRKTSESFTVRGARLTVALQVQEPVIREFVRQSAGLARGSGFLARFLIAWPESTQGSRPFTPPPQGWPALEAYRRRIQALLDTPAMLDAEHTLTPPLLCLSPEAKALWIRFHDDVEAELRPGGKLEDAKDVASKAADNVARLACLFHALEYGPGGLIQLDAVERAGRLVAWYLGEASRFIGAVALPLETVNAVELRDWLVRYCRQHGVDRVSTRDIQRLGPNPTRKQLARDSALEALEDANWLRVVQVGKQKLVRLNPKALQS